jgi:hypothetical protein
LKHALIRIAATFTLALGFATATPAQDAALKAKAERAGLKYEYNKFDDFDSVGALLRGETIDFSYAGYFGKEHNFMVIISARGIMYDDDATFLVDGRRIKIVPIKRHYGQFGTIVQRDEMAAFASAHALAVKVGAFEYDFTAAEIAKIKAMHQVAGGVEP